MVRIDIDLGEIRRSISNMPRAYIWGPIILNRVMTTFGREGAEAMKEVLRPHRYTGILEDSVVGKWNPASKELSIGPTAKRRSHDAGDIFELGTKKIPNVPWQPIRKWGLTRGLTLKQIAGIWKKIQESGVASHPFVERTAQGTRFQTALLKASDAIARDMAAEVFKGDNGTGTTI